MAIRYSGKLKLTMTIVHDGGLLTPATYKVCISAGGRQIETIRVQGAAGERRPIDSPEVYDLIARAAVSFALCTTQELAATGEDWIVTRRR